MSVGRIQCTQPISVPNACDFPEALYLATKEEALLSMHDNLRGMGASHSLPCSDSRTEPARDADDWCEVTDEDFSDNECELPAEENDIVLLPAAFSATPRTVWEVLADRLGESSFEAKFVDLEQRKLNAAAIKKRYQLDPTKRHIWKSKCGRHEVAGYFNLYAKGIVGLFTEDGFPVYVKLDELSDEDVRFVMNKLSDPLRGKVDAQFGGRSTIKRMEHPTDGRDNQTVQESSATTTEPESTNEEPKHMTDKGYRESWRKQGLEATNRLLKGVESPNQGRMPGNLWQMNARNQLLESHPAVDFASPYETISTTRSTNTGWKACDPVPRTSAPAQARASEGGSVLYLPQRDGKPGPLPPDARLAGARYPGAGTSVYRTSNDAT